MRWVVIGIVAGLFIILLIIRFAYLAKYKRDMYNFTYRFIGKFARRCKKTTEEVVDNRAIVYYTNEPSTLYYSNNPYIRNQERRTVVRYTNKKADRYGKGTKIFWIVIFILSFIGTLIVTAAYLVNLLNLNFDFLARMMKLIQFIGRLPIVVAGAAVCLFSFIAIFINASKRRIYFQYKPLYIDYLNAKQINSEGTKRYVEIR